MNTSYNNLELENNKKKESNIETKLNTNIEKREEKKKGIYKNLISGVNF